MDSSIASELPEVLDFGPVYLPRDQMIAFAERFDPQPFHIDEEAAMGTLLGGLAASAWYVCAKLIGSLQAAVRDRGILLDVAGAEQVILLAPVRADDTLSGKMHFSPVRSCDCGGRASTGRLEATNQRGESVVRLLLDCIIRKESSNDELAFENCELRRARPARVRRKSREDAIRFFDEVEIGDQIVLGSFTFGQAEVADYLACTQSGDQQLFIQLHEGKPVVPSWHLMGAWMQRMVRYYQQEVVRFAACGRAAPLLGPAAGIKQLRWQRPVSIGDTITFRGWAERKIEIATQKKWGLLVVGAEGIDCRNNSVLSFYPQMLLERA
jgi:acyl dehydratase